MKLYFIILLTVSLFSSSFLFANKTKKSRLSVNPNGMSFIGYKFLAKDKPVIALTYKNINKVKFELYKIKDLKKLVKDKRYYNSYFSLKIYNDKSIKKTRIKRWTKKLKYKDDYQRESFKLNKLKPGLYLLYAKTNKGIETATTINISSNVLIVKRKKSKLFIYSSDAVTGEAIKNADIYIVINKLNNKTNKSKSIYRKGKTDKNGIFTIFDENFIKNEDITLDFSITVLKTNKNAFLYSYGATGYLSTYTYHKAFVYTDKPIYTPNEKLFYKLFIRSERLGVYSIPNKDFKLIVEDKNLKKVFEEKLILNKTGSFAGSFSLNKFAEGPYMINIQKANGETVSRNAVNFKIKKFHSPKSKKELKKSTKLYSSYKQKRENPDFNDTKNLKINSITLDKKTYLSNEKAKVLIKTKNSNIYTLLSIETKDDLKYQLEYIKGNEKTIELNLDKSMLPNALIKLAYFEDLKFKEIKKYILIKPIDKLLTIHLSNKQKEYKINKEVEFKVKVTDYKGEPVKNAELNFFMLDADIYSIVGDPNPNIFNHFYHKFEDIEERSHYSIFSPLLYKKYKKGDNNQGVMIGVGAGLYDDKQKIYSKPSTKTYWQANIKTDKNGEAVIKVKFPKDITKWKLVIKAITKDTMLGEYRAIIKSQK